MRHSIAGSFLLLLVGVTMGYKILVVFPVPNKSHWILGSGYVRHLLDDGHEVTWITSTPAEKPHANLTIVDVSDLFKDVDSDVMTFDKLINKEVELKGTVLLNLFMNFANSSVTNKNVQKMLKDPKVKFDVAIFEWMFTETYAGFAAYYNCPYIWAVPMESSWTTLELMDDRPNPAYTSDVLSSNFAPFSFLERLQELFIQILGGILKQIYIVPTDVAIYEEVFKPLAVKHGRVLPPFEEVRFNASLMFGNTHVSLGAPTSLPQSYKPIGGYHIDTDLKPLPDNVKKIMDSAKHGVIYFSMGSNLKSKDLPASIKNDLLALFGELKYTVIWKFEENLQETPRNVHIIQWAPQTSILAHPNCILFITHGGLLSTTETVHYGVPIIGLPVFGDQFLNVERYVKKGFAKKILWSYNVAAELREAINEMMSNPEYSLKVKQVSAIYHDRVASPGAELKHWVRHVIETGGAPHLRSHALGLTWYQRTYMDLAFVIICLVLLLHYMLKKLFCSKKDNKKIVNKKKNN